MRGKKRNRIGWVKGRRDLVSRKEVKGMCEESKNKFERQKIKGR